LILIPHYVSLCSSTIPELAQLPFFSSIPPRQSSRCFLVPGESRAFPGMALDPVVQSRAVLGFSCFHPPLLFFFLAFQVRPPIFPRSACFLTLWKLRGPQSGDSSLSKGIPLSGQLALDCFLKGPIPVPFPSDVNRLKHSLTTLLRSSPPHFSKAAGHWRSPVFFRRLYFLRCVPGTSIVPRRSIGFFSRGGRTFDPVSPGPLIRCWRPLHGFWISNLLLCHGLTIRFLVVAKRSFFVPCGFFVYLKAGIRRFSGSRRSFAHAPQDFSLWGEGFPPYNFHITISLHLYFSPPNTPLTDPSPPSSSSS